MFSVYLGAGTDDPEIEVIPGGKNGTGKATPYWDCCKPFCGFEYFVSNSKPIASCKIDGHSHISIDNRNGCEEKGDAYTCSNQQPWAINKTFAYGFAAGSMSGGLDTRYCCACFLLTFQGKLKGKKMLVQYTNTQMTLHLHQFNLGLPGGGVGEFHRGCAKQWKASENGWNVQNATQCSELPKPLQHGCKFRYDFLEGVNNPNLTFIEVKCPHVITNITGCDHVKSVNRNTKIISYYQSYISRFLKGSL